MTAIIGIRRKGQVVIAADGISTNDKIKRPATDCQVKVRTFADSSIIFAGSGNCSGIYAIRAFSELFKGVHEISFKAMVNHFVPSIIKMLSDNDLLVDFKYGQELPCSMLIGTKKRLFKVDYYGTVTECQSFASSGSGSDVLVSAYSLYKDKIEDPKELALKCLELTIEYGPNIGYPISVACNDDKGVEIIRK